MLPIAADFLDSLKAQIHNTASLSSFIYGETYLNGRKFSTIGHEYQSYVVKLVEQNPGVELIIGKPSQIGLSEIVTRIVLARMAIRPGTSVLLSFPSRQLSSEIFSTRWSPVIDDSPRLRRGIDVNVNSASVKRFTNNSIAYALSGNPSSKTTLISRPISDIVVDEIDRQDADIVNSYGSRTTHTPTEQRLTIKLSTPTAVGVGIDAELDECRQIHVPMTVCEHCSHRFEPDFFINVRIPGYEGAMRDLTKRVAAKFNLSEAWLQCPECDKHVKTQSYVWEVHENPEGTQNKIGVRLNPFIAPKFIRMSDLVNSYLTFSDLVEFQNQKLGQPASLQDSSISREEITFCIPDNVRGRYVLGVDLGKVCHILVGVLRADLSLHVLDAKIVKLTEIEEEMENLTRKYAFFAMVMDSQPYTELVYRLVKKYPRLYSAIYVDPNPPIPELFKLKLHDKHGEMVRQISINKNPAFDLMAGSLKGFITFSPNQLESLIIQHLLDMRRIRDYSKSAAGVFKWIKSAKGEDHFAHTLIYLYLASKLAVADLLSDAPFPIKVGKMKIKN